VCDDPLTVTLEPVMVTAPLVNVALSCVAVPAPLDASNVTASVDAGRPPVTAPPEAVAQWVASEKFPVPPTQ
jgi:hypothetical protein